MALFRTVHTEGFGTLGSGDGSFDISLAELHDTDAIIDEIKRELNNRFHDDYLDMVNRRAWFEYTIAGGDSDGQLLVGSDTAVYVELMNPDNTRVGIKVTKVQRE
ncbi:hypothetical protein LPJ61_006222 [Coemansia biformis]|uniref:Uncharacterized protein n=1 Tax=Coemansia biformis TaxID=1286918 RepID=A0A9W8CNA9_9FUNG|nr:hypothetical protein LPJ61_006222 [Coemansia biformis]